MLRLFLLSFLALFVLIGAQTKRFQNYIIASPVGFPAGKKRDGSPFILDPIVVKSLYNFPRLSTAGAGKTIGIVDAYNHPNIESDLAHFCSTWALPRNC